MSWAITIYAETKATLIYGFYLFDGKKLCYIIVFQKVI